MVSREINVWKSLDWWIIALYALMVFAGCVSIYAASYDFDNASFFDFTERSGKQLIWIGFSFIIGAVILLIDVRTYETLAYFIYGLLIVLLIITIFIAPEIKGSRSWLVLGPVNLQPAEFAKFATSLALARMMSTYNFNLIEPRNLIKVCAIIFLPFMLIIMQKETGSALVYCALVLVLYREGMTGLVLFAGLCAVAFFVLAVKFGGEIIGVTPLGEALVLGLIMILCMVMLLTYRRDNITARNLLILTFISLLIPYVCSLFGIELNYTYFLMFDIAVSCIYLLIMYLQIRVTDYLIIITFVIAFVLFLFSVDYVFNNVLEPHQQVRIRVSLGMEDDPRGAGYNVNQAKIAIGSGGFLGKGFLNGTQTKLKYVPEQDTDFIFCTIGEEEGFLGASFVVIAFMLMIARLIYLAERQRWVFGRIYGYCVAGIIFFHVAINIGMVLGLCPVIGIPLPFYSYGGSSLWGFTILLFIFLRIDASRTERF